MFTPNSLFKYITNPERIEHIKRVVKTVNHLSKNYPVNQKNIETAAWLHDIVKEYNPEKAIASFNIDPEKSLEKIFDEYPAVWHAFVGPVILKKHFKIESTEILEAIECHSTGKENMSVFDMILYVADYAEPGRNREECVDILSIAEKDIEKAAFMVAKSSLNYLKVNNLKIH